MTNIFSTDGTTRWWLFGIFEAPEVPIENRWDFWRRSAGAKWCQDGAAFGAEI